MYTPTGASNSYSITFTVSDSTQSFPTKKTTTSTIPTAAILGVALGILIIAVMLAVIGVTIICKKTGSSVTNEERLCHIHTPHKKNRKKKGKMLKYNVQILSYYIIIQAYAHKTWS